MIKSQESSVHLSPVILDASVFGSSRQIQTLIESNTVFFVSSTLYELLRGKESPPVIDALQNFVTWPVRYPPPLFARAKLRLEPYRYREKYVEELLPFYKASELTTDVKNIIMDEYSFLKQHSAILMYTKRFPKHLYKWGIATLDAGNKVYYRKKRLFQRVRGTRWFLGVLLQGAGLATIPSNTILGYAMAGSGVLLAIFDP